MCLWTVTKIYKTPQKAVVKAWKIVNSFNFLTPFQRFRITKNWRKATKETLRTESSPSVSYPSGFHVFPDKTSATKALKREPYSGRVIPVEVKDIVCKGTDGTGGRSTIKNLVARQIRLFPKKKKASKKGKENAGYN